jgi:hypothetical protein
MKVYYCPGTRGKFSNIDFCKSRNGRAEEFFNQNGHLGGGNFIECVECRDKQGRGQPRLEGPQGKRIKIKPEEYTPRHKKRLTFGSGCASIGDRQLEAGLKRIVDIWEK